VKRGVPREGVSAPVWLAGFVDRFFDSRESNYWAFVRGLTMANATRSTAALTLHGSQEEVEFNAPLGLTLHMALEELGTHRGDVRGDRQARRTRHGQSENGELQFSRRCVDERGARYVAESFKQDLRRTGWTE
jgi:hypothetical protein